jgi:hypothetical protein
VSLRFGPRIDRGSFLGVAWGYWVVVFAVGAVASCGGKSNGVGGGSGGPSAGQGGLGGTQSSGGAMNLLVNGDFSEGDQNWQFTDEINATAGVSDGAFCVALDLGGYGVVGYPTGAPLSLSGATTYEFSFDAWGTGRPTITAKVGDAEVPFTDYTTMAVAVGVDVESYAQRFVQLQDDPTAGVAFIVSALAETTDACFDNVTLRVAP